MSYSVLSLLLLNVASAVLAVRYLCVHAGRMRIDHVLLFSTGFLLYWILPVAGGLTGIYRNESWMALWYGLFDAVPAERLAGYLLVCALCYGGFVAGSVFAGIGGPNNAGNRWPFDRRFEVLFFIPFLVAGIVFGFAVRHELFHGYAGIEEDFGYRGSFTAASLFLLALAVVDMAKRHDRLGAASSARMLVQTPLFAAYFFFALLVLSMGGRLYFVSSVLMLATYITVYIRRVRVATVGVGVAGLAGLSGLVGLFRLGAGGGVAAIFINLLSEFFFTSFSLLNFLANHGLAAIRAPIFLFSDFTNLIPLFVFPQKADLAISPSSRGYEIFSPFGALNSFFSFQINFGIAGTILVLFSFGACLTWLRANARSPLSRTVYTMLCGWLAFSFFRDPFSISIVKNMVEFSVVVPTVLVCGLRMLTLAGMRDSVAARQ